MFQRPPGAKELLHGSYARKKQQSTGIQESVSSTTDMARPGTSDIQNAAEDGACQSPNPSLSDAATSKSSWEGCDRPFGSSSGRNKESLEKTALAADRYGVSNRAATAICNAFRDTGRISAHDRTLIVDPKKLWRERCRVRQEQAQVRSDALCT